MAIVLVLAPGCAASESRERQVRVVPTTTTVPVQDPARHDTSVIDRTIREMDATTTTTPRTLPGTK